MASLFTLTIASIHLLRIQCSLRLRAVYDTPSGRGCQAGPSSGVAASPDAGRRVHEHDGFIAESRQRGLPLPLERGLDLPNALPARIVRFAWSMATVAHVLTAAFAWSMAIVAIVPKQMSSAS